MSDHPIAFVALAREFHGTCERLAAERGLEKSQNPSWDDAPESLRDLLTATITDMIERGTIRIGRSPG